MHPLSEDIRENVLDFAEEIAGEFGLEVFELNLSQVRTGWQIRLVLDKLEGFVSVDDCAQVSRRLQARIDLEQVLPPDGYTMEVSSPGLNRPLRGENDFRRFMGQLAKIKARSAKGGYSVSGRIIGIENGSVKLAGEEGELEVNLSDIKEARLIPEIPINEPNKKKGKKKRK